MPASLPTQLIWITMIAVFALAVWRGGMAERLGAAISIVSGLAVIMIHAWTRADVAPLLLLAADALLAGGFLFLAVRYASLWLGAAMIFQAVQFALHAIYTSGEIPHDRRYAIINNLVTFAIFAVILGATLLTWRRRVRAARAAAAEPAAIPPTA